MKVLLAVDGSECSERAARFLTRFAFSPEDEIGILHVISDIPYDDDSYANIRRFMKRVAPEVLESAAKILNPVPAKILKQEVNGYPYSTIVEEAEKGMYEMIVLGTRGLRGLQSLFIGSVTRSVATHSGIPVLITRRSPWKDLEKMKVLLATDGSDSSRTTAELLESMPLPQETECTILTVSWSDFCDIPDRFRPELEDRYAKDLAHIRELENSRAFQCMEASRVILQKEYDNVKESVRTGDPATEILQAVEDVQADIVALGCRGLKGMKGLLGSVSRRVLGHAQCSVLIGK